MVLDSSAEKGCCHASSSHHIASHLRDTPSPLVCNLVFTTSNGVVCMAMSPRQTYAAEWVLQIYLKVYNVRQFKPLCIL